MLLIPCPYCGERAQVEFAYGGDATRQRPPDGAPDEAWYEYVYLRSNPRGPHREWWLHHAGCGRWIRVIRDTATHAVLGAESASGPARADADPETPAAGSETDRIHSVDRASPGEASAVGSREGAGRARSDSDAGAAGGPPESGESEA